MAVIDSWGAGEEEAAAEGDASGALEECDKAALKEEDEEPAEKADEAEEAAEAEENPKEALPEVEFTAEEAKEVAQETAEAAIEADLPKDEEEKEEAIAEVAEEKVEAAAEEKLAAEEAPAEELPSEEHKPAEAAEAEEAEPAAKAVEPEPEPEFKEDDVDDLDECSLNKHIDEYLKEVYSNVKSYETTGCELKEGKLFVEGKISFNSGKEKSTIFEFLPAYDNGKLFFEGVNKDFSEGKAFKLNCSIDESKTLITESIGYSYKINESLVEGLK